MSDLTKKVFELKNHLESVIVGQDDLIKKMLIALLSSGHILLEGAPGLAKTKAIKTLAASVNATFNRIQFTPDLLPSDITGSDIYLAKDNRFEFQKGPVFANFVLADEINRAPAKVQSALLEAMAEHQVSVGSKVYGLPDLFMVMATQNPIEHEGTYNLPEAQLDRFLMYVKINQPDALTEKKILRLVRAEDMACGDDKECWEKDKTEYKKMSTEEILGAHQEVLRVHTSDEVENYIVALVMATRYADKYSTDLKDVVRFGASPRATIALDKCAKANAWLEGRDFVTPEDIHAIAYDVLRHRIILSFEALAENLTADDVIERLLRTVPLP
ncbi:MAG: MoxR family ATPase [Alphaproteobacteria bacterium]|nr:MoxR family ATPase [Alphaproteobacteria bacterium]